MRTRHAKGTGVLIMALLCVCLVSTACSPGNTVQPSQRTPLALGQVELGKKTFTYTGATQKPSVAVFDEKGHQLTESDYKIKWQSKKSTKPGSYKVTVKGVSGYTGTLSASYKIKRAKLKKKRVKLSTKAYTYDGKKHRPKVAVYGTASEKVPRRFYSIKWANGKPAAPGKYYATVKGKGPYAGSVKLSYRIKRVPLSPSNVKLKRTHYYYNGTSRKPSVAVKAKVNGTKRTLTRGRDYKVKYERNASVGTARAVIKGKGNFSGIIVEEFSIELDPRWPVHNRSIAKTPERQRWYNAAAHMGSYCTMVGPVENVYQATQSTGMPIFVDIGASYPSAARLTLVIWAEDLDDFERMLHQVDHGGAWIKISGYLRNYNGMPQFNSNNPLTFQWWTNVR